MRTLYLVRHAKASRDDPSLSDRERPLTERGLDDAPKAGKRLARHGAQPDLIVCSPAARALATAQLIAAELGYARAGIVVDDALYAAGVDDLLAVIGDTDKHVVRLMLCGHNPEFSDLASRLAGRIVDMPTCAVAQFEFDAPSWSDIGARDPLRFTLDKPER
jgi:phosphohistidine phosphatase